MSPNPQYVILFHHFRKFLEAAYSRGLDVAPLKGAHLLTSVYPDDENRGLLADVDFLVHPKDWNRTLDILLELNFEQKIHSDRPATMESFYEAGFSLALFGEKKIIFEPHRFLIQKERHNIDYDALWDRSIESTFDGAPCRRLTAEDHVLHAVIHLMTNWFEYPRRCLRDVELLVKRGGADLGVVKKRAVQFECERALWLTLRLLANQLHDSSFAPEDAMVPLPNRIALSALVPDPDGFRFPNLGLRQKQAIFFPLLMDGAAPLLRFASHYGLLRLRDRLGRNHLRTLG